MPSSYETKNLLIPWVILVSTVAIHIVDEIMTDFLPFYNQFVHEIRSEFGFFPLPTYSFGSWIIGVWVVVIFGYSLTPIVARAGNLIKVVVSVIALLMFVNGMLNLLLSWYFRTWVPGATSSPLLLFASIFLLVRVWLYKRNNGDGRN